MMVRLGDILKVRNGFAFKSDLFCDQSCGVPLVRIRDIKSSQTEVNYRGDYRNEFVVNTGDLLIGMDGDFECHKWQGGLALLNQRVCRLQEINPDALPQYIYYSINSKLREIHETTAFVTVKHISSKQIENIQVPLPPLAEQQRIVDILDRAAAIQRLRRAAEEKAREIIPALFVDMFGDPATNPKGWPSLPVPRAFADVTSLAGKVERSAYLQMGALPIFDQGQNESPGFTNETRQVFRGSLPVILFGDHTRVFRLITQPFVRGADGVRLLAPMQMLNPWYAVAGLKLLKLPSLGYSRHYRELKRLSLPIPPYEAQERFALRVQQMEAVSDQIKAHAVVAQDLAKAMLSLSFNDTVA